MIRILLELIQRVKKSFFWIWRQEGTPAERARGVAVGIFSGCFPFFGFQSLIGVLLASWFKGNHLMAVAATWISNPFTYVPLYWFNYHVGSILLGPVQNLAEPGPFSFSMIWTQGWIFSSRLLIGSTLVGLFASSIVGTIVYFLLSRLFKMKRFD